MRQLFTRTVALSTTIFLLLTACNDRQIEAEFLKDTPDSADVFFQMIKNYTKDLNLKSLSSGTDSLELRIWFHNELFLWDDHLLLIKIEEKNLKAFFCSFFRQQFPMTGIDSFKVKSINIKSEFLNKLKQEKILDLPSADKIPDFKYNHNDGWTWIIETATKDSYRFYYYATPEIYDRKFPDCAQMVKISELLQKELGFPPAPIDPLARQVLAW